MRILDLCAVADAPAIPHRPEPRKDVSFPNTQTGAAAGGVGGW